jgi:hypothetical protein
LIRTDGKQRVAQQQDLSRENDFLEKEEKTNREDRMTVKPIDRRRRTAPGGGGTGAER